MNPDHTTTQGRFFLSNDNHIPPNIWSVLKISQVIKAGMLSAVEIELEALYINTQEAVYIRLILTKMEYLKLPTPIQTEKSIVEGILNSKI